MNNPSNQYLKDLSQINPYDAEEVAKLNNAQIAQFYSKFMVEGLLDVNKKGGSEFGDYEQDKDKLLNLYEKSVQLIKNYLDKNCPE